MKQSDIRHLRRLVGWVRCEAGPTPAEIVSTVREILPKIGPVSDDGKQRLVEWHDDARRVPKYIRAAVKALEKMLGEQGSTFEAEAPEAATPALERVLLAWEAKATRGVGSMINDANTARAHAEEVRRAIESDASALKLIGWLVKWDDWEQTHLVGRDPDPHTAAWDDEPPSEIILLYAAEEIDQSNAFAPLHALGRLVEEHGDRELLIAWLGFLERLSPTKPALSLVRPEDPR